ncbi:hypothetical protein IM538_08325 [Cytobacillus suaedae]|nr:hypothetical protein IM538_08325 [Cytobacillus suaedae]
MKKGILFTIGYCVFILLAAGIGFYYSSDNTPEGTLTNEAKQNEVKQAFSEALKADEERIEKKKESEDPDKWTPSPGFVLTAVSIGAIADIVIVILWARHENRKREIEDGTNLTRKKRLTDSNLFWWVIGLGIVRKRNDKLIVDWKYVLAYIILGLLLKVWLTKELF